MFIRGTTLIIFQFFDDPFLTWGTQFVYYLLLEILPIVFILVFHQIKILLDASNTETHKIIP
jgi:hypothetical protein